MRAYLQLIRYGNCLMAAFSAAIGVLIAYNIISGTAGQIPFPLQEIIYVALVVFLVTGAGNAINDYYDIEIDRINKPERPIPSGRISKSKALYFSISLFASGTVIAFFINTICGVIALFNSLLLVYYAATLKRTVLIGNLSVGYLTGSTFLFGGAVFYTNGGIEAVSILFLLATLATIAREIVKDIEDIEGDKLDGASTLAISIGAEKAAYVASTIGFIAVIASPLPYMQSLLTMHYLAVVFVADMLFFMAVVAILKEKKPAKSSKLFKMAMFAALIAFLVGT
ncbi:MAG: geranylgeranylglycerol-phosphate geranylgeranyltransferase [Methanomethylovorans sp.]|uniref:geranylgeranylglycerol-phosphate geranylgeranyltransferase n=1 Tax=Methanomethylovorans sp. TaxID=2758717 RepID=UPI003530E209